MLAAVSAGVGYLIGRLAPGFHDETHHLVGIHKDMHLGIHGKVCHQDAEDAST